MPNPSDNPQATEAARDLLRSALARDTKTTPLCRAVMGWLCDAATEPSVAEVRVGGDGRVWLRLSDEAYPEPTGTFLEFLEQIHVICASLEMSEEQARATVGWAQFRLF